MCGEHSLPSFPWPCEQGSSPHVRGTHRQVACEEPHRGIIPACAGNTRYARNPARLRRDHPRMCGEHTREDWIDEQAAGSSPHVRGTLLFDTVV